MDSETNLPVELDELVGRKRELQEVSRLLTSARLVTITGAGGAGKTRLASAAGRALLSGFPYGVWFVDLAPVAPEGLESAVARSLGIREERDQPLLASLTSALKHRDMLLLLDNCEHVVGGCARIAGMLLRNCPRLRILATSREPLRVTGERIWRLDPLPVPSENASTVAEISQAASVSLFTNCARARTQSFFLDVDKARWVAAICRTVDGIPLAIELAAAQMPAMSAREIAQRMAADTEWLAGGSRERPRHETMRAALQWSYALLEPDERLLLPRLSAFKAGFTMDAAEHTAAFSGLVADSVPGLIRALVDKSLVEVTEVEGGTRYRLLEPVRQFAASLLSSQEHAAVVTRQAAYLVQLVEAASPYIFSGGRRPWMDRLTAEHGNIRSVLGATRRSTSGGDRELGLRLAGLLAWCWSIRGDTTEGLALTEAALSAAPDAALAVRAWGLYGASELAWLVGREADARAWAEEAVDVFSGLGDKRGLAFTLQSLPMAVDHPNAAESVAESVRLFRELGDPWGAVLAQAAQCMLMLATGAAAAPKLLEQNVADWEHLGDDWGAAQSLNCLGDSARNRGFFAEAMQWYEQALASLRRSGIAGTVPSLLHNLGLTAIGLRDTRAARTYLLESLALFRDQGDRRGVADCLTALALLRETMDQPGEAARLMGTAEAVRTAVGASVWPGNSDSYQACCRRLRVRLGDDRLREHWRQGSRADPDEVVAGLLPSPEAHMDPGGGLTSREREVTGLVARGMSNRDIASTLFITEGTANQHVKHVLSKLGFSSRSQIAAWAVSSGMVAVEDPRTGS